MTHRIFQLTLILIGAFSFGAICQTASAQPTDFEPPPSIDGNLDQGVVPPGGFTDGNFDANNGTGNLAGNNGTGTGGGDFSDFTSPEDLFGSLQDNFNDVDDARGFGFVGPTAENLGGALGENAGEPLGFVGPTNEGLNFQPGNSGAGGGRGTANASGERGFSVVRGNIRTRLRQGFTAPVVSSQQISRQFTSELMVTPATQNFAGGISVSINDGTAVLSGAVRT